MAHPVVQTDKSLVRLLPTDAEARLDPPTALSSGDVTSSPVAMATCHPDTSTQQGPARSTLATEQTDLTVLRPCRTREDSVYDVIESVIQQARASRTARDSEGEAGPLTPSTSAQLTLESEGDDGDCSKDMGAGHEEATDGVYVCPVCSRECSAPKYLKLHLLKHENDRQRPLDCDVCGKTFSTHQSMKLHRYTHTGGKTFSTHQSMKLHRYTHTGEKPYVCQICHKHFRQAGTLKRHMVTHTGEQPHRCPRCPRHFSQRSSLTAHLRLHTEQNSFLCVHCGKSFKTERYMKRHLIYHTDRLPFSCELCDKRFRTRLNMRRHMLRIHLLATRKVCRCLTCGAEMQNPGALKNHMAVHSAGRKPYRAYVCEICGRRFQQRSKLKKHKQDKHGDSDELDNHPGLTPQVRADQVCRVMTRTTGQQRVTTYEMIPKDLDQFAHIVFPVNGRPSRESDREGRGLGETFQSGQC
ncbi:PREDICTED: zinc finger protein OZF-like [Branchiostoma belcheri]|uniref:Zinc finger protein OZF-like n=1 Tax=Branchiostoma belcheri TaxID=7741 RepID=A0A6P4Z014_BRABE|nr:PREDICTED: zinc finger protein OZF-like [Branchiostoma belcheri]